MQVTKEELVSRMASKTKMTKKDTSIALNSILQVIEEAVREEKVQLVGFGYFEKRERKETVTRNPGTKELINIPKKNTVVFKAGKDFKDMVNR